MIGVRKIYFKMSTKYQKLCFAKLYRKAPYILFELTVFFYLCYVGEGGCPPKKFLSSFVFNVSRLPDATLKRWQALQN